MIVLATGNPVLLNVLGPLIGGGIGASLTYFGVRRQFSGGIRTSEAATLWQASEHIRQDLTDETRRLREEHAVCEKQRQLQEVRIVRLEGELDRMNGVIQELKGDEHSHDPDG